VSAHTHSLRFWRLLCMPNVGHIEVCIMDYKGLDLRNNFEKRRYNSESGILLR